MCQTTTPFAGPQPKLTFIGSAQGVGFVFEGCEIDYREEDLFPAQHFAVSEV